MQNVWFISDVHLSHLNSLYFKPRRRELAGISLEELQNGNKKEILAIYDSWLINLWNSTVAKNDVVYILGDLCLGNRERTEFILNRLHGKKYLILGNHDKSCHGLENYFEWVGSIKEVKFSHDQYPFIQENETFCIEMCHYPLMAWNRRTHGSCMAHGHVHGALDQINKKSKELRVDVGLDGELSGYGFISLENLYNYYRHIVLDVGCNSFQEYIDKLMIEQGFRM